VDGNLESSVSNINTIDGASDISTYTRLTVASDRNENTTQDVWIGPIMIWDEQGADLLGTLPNHIHRGTVILPDGAGASAQFSPLAGSNFQNVDDAGIDGDTTYNFSSSANFIDSFTYGAMPWSSAEIYAVTVSAIVRLGTSAPTIRTKTRISAAYFNGATFATTASYAPYETIYEDSPSTTNNWTDTEINAAEFGYERVAGAGQIRVTKSFIEVFGEEASTDTLRVSRQFIEVIMLPGVAPSGSGALGGNVVT
jgi:hypothetical protein